MYDTLTDNAEILFLNKANSRSLLKLHILLDAPLIIDGFSTIIREWDFIITRIMNNLLECKLDL